MAAKSDKAAGFDCQLVEPPPANLLQIECPICLQIIRDPHQVTCCGYSYCRSCIEHIRAKDKPCPTCQEKEPSVFSNKGLKRSLYALKAYCSHQIEGCEWTGELGQLDEHLSTDPQPKKTLEGCSFVEIKCSDCNGIVKRCDFECHVQTVCSVIIVDCDFHHVGCDIKLPRRDMSKHVRDNLTAHISLLAISHAKQQKEIAQQKAQIAELSTLTTSHQNEIVRLCAENEALKKAKPAIEVPREKTEYLLPSEIVTMTDFKRHKDEDIVWYSPPIYTHPRGYKICFAVYPNGDGPGKNTHLSVYTHLMPGDYDDHLAWPLRGEIRYQLLSQEGSDCHKGGVSTYHERRSDKSCSRVLYAQRSQGLGMGKFLPLGQLEPKYLQNDSLKLQLCGGNVRL